MIECFLHAMSIKCLLDFHLKMDKLINLCHHLSPFVSRYWPYGSDGCQTHGFQGFMTALASIHFMAAIAWDRYHQYCTSK